MGELGEWRREDIVLYLDAKSSQGSWGTEATEQRRVRVWLHHTSACCMYVVEAEPPSISEISNINHSSKYIAFP